MINFLFLLIGFIIIIISSNILINTISSLAIKLKIPKMIIATSLVSIGTCAPEIAISFNSISSSSSDVALSNVIGSCIVNIFLIIGLSAIIKPIKVNNSAIKKEIPFLLLINSMFSLILLKGLLINKVISRLDSLILIVLFIFFVVYLIKNIIRRKKDSENIETKYNVVTSLILFIISLILIIFSSNLIVDNAVIISDKLHISEKIVTLLFIAIGSSLPELFTSINSARKKEFDLSLGNIIGANILNISLVLALPILIFGSIKVSNFNYLDIFILSLSAIILYIFSKTNKVISRKEGIFMVFTFFLYYAITIL